MKVLLLAFLTLLTGLSALRAQDFPQDKIDNAEMRMARYDKDTTAHAVVLNEFGKTWVSTADHLPLIHEYHIKIKIFDEKAFDEANVTIRLYNNGENIETVKDIKGITYYNEGDGLIKKAMLDPQKIYKEKLDKHHDLVKFTLPNLHKGCVIEYSYVTESPYHYNFHGWEFQSDIPKVYSEYEVHIPAIYEYNIVLRGYLKLSKNPAEIERECFSYYGTKADCSKITYAINDIPAFVGESHMTAPSNFISAMYFELSAMTNQYGTKEKITQDWQSIDRELKSSDYFGSQIKRRDVLKDRLPPAIYLIKDTLEKAQAIYTFVQKWYKWDHSLGMYSEDGIKKALDAHTGNVGNINLSLIAALYSAGINTEAVVLSTRDNGAVNKLFPQTSDFDYVVARVTIGNKPYMLDATDPLLGFGMLPLRCINDQGRVMSLNKPSYWIDMVETQRSTRISTLDLTLQPDGKAKGSITTFYTGYNAYEKRQAIKKFNSVEEYVENIDEKLNKLKILKSEIINLDSLNLPLTEKYEVVLDVYNTLDKESLAFDPAFWDQETENPFKLTERTYPVDLGSTIDHRLVLNLHYPDNFVISTTPNPVAIALPNKGGKFLTGFETDNNTLTYSQVQQFSKAIYQPEEYPYLKELFNKMIQNQKATVIFKKK